MTKDPHDDMYPEDPDFYDDDMDMPPRKVDTPAHYTIEINGTPYDVDDITEALGDKLENYKSTTGDNSMSLKDVHDWMAAIEYVLRAPFKGQYRNDLIKATTRLQGIM